ncbi:hypothetical protein KC363_g1638 [Hortaea werneckii]|uniref:Uncharacterized protein n=1 Tax=Hortaea werneckii TaxID=91943 RepID=A0A3M7G5T1_HORWE|nr:hypothetical protein KC361_g4841 [Hortaea werneckii]KAI6887284.1 hypothetical protein KC325_g2254 [Hortaea werneckii]KAI6997684.1 hypothetical protein KC359_g2817 [Hortaea werneckii]KAI7148723.1 hypothetical protein KC344_g1696 [Hortaea werneckii]KAI7178375.1 hypothetical protein KC360_g1668 [Hortaea werneckii]
MTGSHPQAHTGDKNSLSTAAEPSPYTLSQQDTSIDIGGTSVRLSMHLHSASIASTQNSTLPSPCKILVVGDSITQGHEGDHTWRYRLWQWLRSNETSHGFNFVGPYTGTDPPAAPRPPQPPRLGSDEPEEPEDSESTVKADGKYAVDVSADFQGNHFSGWGWQLGQAKDMIRDVVSVYKPDLILTLLGFNDIGWGFCQASEVLNRMRDFIQEARAAKPDVALLVGNIPQRRYMNGRQDLLENTTEYNQQLPRLLDAMRSDLSPLHAVNVAQCYSCTPEGCPAGYDGLHPNILGEFQIARAFSLTLHDFFGIGDAALEVPSPQDMPQRPSHVPTNVVATGAPMGVTVTWDAVFGARGYDVRNRTQGKDKWEIAQAQSNRFDTTFTIAGIAWEYQVRANNGDGDKDKSDWSPVSTAVARRDTAPPPQNIQTFSKDHSIRVTWSSVEGGWEVDRYAVTVLDQDTPGAIIICYGFRGTEATLHGLRNGHCYSVFVGTWAFVDGVSVGGLPAQAASVTPGVLSENRRAH